MISFHFVRNEPTVFLTEFALLREVDAGTQNQTLLTSMRSKLKSIQSRFTEKDLKCPQSD